MKIEKHASFILELLEKIYEAEETNPRLKIQIKSNYNHSTALKIKFEYKMSDESYGNQQMIYLDELDETEFTDFDKIIETVRLIRQGKDV